MKKIIILGLIAVCSFTSIQAQEQWSMFSKITADWCPNCGTWGWTMFEDGIEAMQDRNVLSWTLHHSGGLTNPVASDINDNFNAFSQPRFYLNNDDIGVSSGNVDNKIKELEETVDAINGFAPFAAVTNSAIYNGTDIMVQSEVEFLEEVPGNYYVANYLVEDHVIFNQSNQGANADHRYVLRDVFEDDSFGSLVASPVAENGFVASSTQNYTIELEEEDVSDFYIATVIWNLTPNDGYRVFNLFVSNVVYAASSTIDATLFDDYNVTTNNNIVSIDVNHTEKYDVKVYTLDGKTLVSRTGLNGSNQLDLGNGPSKMVLVNIIEGNTQATKQFFIK